MWNSDSDNEEPAKQQSVKPNRKICPCLLSQSEGQSYGLRLLGENLSVPLREISYSTSIVNGIADTVLTQVYHNPFDSFLETEYFLPISERVCFTGFKAIYEGKEVSGLVKEKEQARKEYEVHKKSGAVVGYSEINEACSDILKIKLGNIEPGKFITIKMTYIEDLEVCASNKLWKHTIFSIVRPRYSPAGSIPGPDIVVCDHPMYTWDITTNISSDSKIPYVRSPTHEIEVNSSETSTTVTLSCKNTKNIPTKDFVLLFGGESVNKPRAVLGKVTDDAGTRFSANVTFVPNFSNITLDDALKQIDLNNKDQEEFDLNIDSARGEYIFLLDRSGSMEGKRIELAKESLILSLKSLPKESYYNVCSFGSNFKMMHEESVKLSEQQLLEDEQIIRAFKADMSNTEILDPLNFLIGVPTIVKYPRQIFLLTDGDVSNVKEILRRIHLGSKTCRFHMIGIGTGASSELIKEGAKVGRGKSLLLNDDDDISAKITDVFKKSLSPCIDNVEIEFDHELIDIVSPNPKNIGCILKNEPFILATIFKKEIQTPFKTTIKLKFFDSHANAILEYSLQLDSNTTEQHQSVYKYACFKYLKDLLRTSSNNYDLSNDIFTARVLDTEKEIVEVSIREQILTNKTAFICLIKESNDSLVSEKSDKGTASLIIPSYQSEDNRKSIQMKEDRDREKERIFMMKKQLAEAEKLLNCDDDEEFLFRYENEGYSVFYMEHEISKIISKRYKEILGKMERIFHRLSTCQDESGFWCVSSLNNFENLTEDYLLDSCNPEFGKFGLNFIRYDKFLDILTTVFVLLWLNKYERFLLNKIPGYHMNQMTSSAKNYLHFFEWKKIFYDIDLCHQGVNSRGCYRKWR